MTIAARLSPQPIAAPKYDLHPLVRSVRPTVAADTEFSLVTTRREFDRLEAEWSALFDRAGQSTQIFQTFNWCWHWANHYLDADGDGGAKSELSIIVARRGGRVVMIWPLVRQRTHGLTQILWMGDPVSQYGDVIIDDIADADDILHAGWNFLLAHSKGAVLRLRRVRSDAAIAPLLRDIGATVTDRQIAPFTDLTSAANFAEYELRYSPRSRRNRRRLARRLAEQGSVSFVRYKGGVAARELAIKGLDLKAEWLKERGLVSAAIADERMTRMFADVAEGKTKSGDCIVSALLVNDEPAAVEINFLCKGRLALHVIVYSLQFEKSGVGVLLLEQGLKNCYDDGIDVYDMLAPGDGYKLDWCDQQTEVLDWVKPLSFAGAAYTHVYLGFVRRRLKSALKNMPQPLRKAISGGFRMFSMI